MQNTSKATPYVLVAAVLVVMGLILMAIKIKADSEPGAIPILLVLLGIGLYVATRRRGRARRA